MCSKNYKQIGMTIVEMGLVLGIVSIIGASMLMDYGEQNTHAKLMESDAKLKVVKKALVSFANQNKYLPCPSDGSGFDTREGKNGKIPVVPATPATPAVPPTATSPAIPAVPAISAQGAISAIPVNVCSLNRGEVPYEAIGLSKADVQDSWGNPFIYAVDQGVTDPDVMIDCPTQTACFFNSDPLPWKMSRANTNIKNDYKALPWFNLLTQPTKGDLGANNLNVYSGIDTGGAFKPEEAIGQIAVLVALNQNGLQSSGLDAEEAENQDGDLDYVNSRYQNNETSTEYFDDLVLSISANDIKRRFEDESYENVVDTSGPNINIQSGNDIANLGDGTVGTSGTNIGTDQGILDQTSQSFSFGEDSAGKEVVLTFNTHATGAWDKDATATGAFDDRGSISANNSKLREFEYDHLNNDWDGVEEATFTSAINGTYVDLYDQFGNLNPTAVSLGESVTTYQTYWDESHEYVVKLDENGDINLDFEVETTATIETIDFTDIQLVLYNAPSSVPELPGVERINGIPQTYGLR